MIKYHTITIDDYIVPEGSDLPDSIEVEIFANIIRVDLETGGGYLVGIIRLNASLYTVEQYQIIARFIHKNEDRLKEILASK